jgi:hypothetical protein
MLSNLWLALAIGGAPLSALADEISAEPIVVAEPAAVGKVVALSGEVMAIRPGEEPRALQCRDTVYQDERIVTGDGARVDLLLGDVVAHLTKDSRLRVGRTGDDVADMTLEKGGVRAIDPRDTGARARLAVLDARAKVLGNDAEAYIFSEKTGQYAVLCEWDAPLPVTRGDEQALADPGKCVIAKPSEPLYLADAHDKRLGPPGEDPCPLGPVIGDINLHLTPDVAAGPPPAWSGTASAPNAQGISPCQMPGSGCAGAVVVAPPVVGGAFPGAP